MLVVCAVENGFHVSSHVVGARVESMTGRRLEFGCDKALQLMCVTFTTPTNNSHQLHNFGFFDHAPFCIIPYSYPSSSSPNESNMNDGSQHSPIGQPCRSRMSQVDLLHTLPKQSLCIHQQQRRTTAASGDMMQ